jgi:hypothetical protein
MEADMTDERDRRAPEPEEPQDPLVREDVQNALAVDGNLPEGGRSGMEQASVNNGAKHMPTGQGEETSQHDDDGSGDADGGEPRI